MAEANAQSLEVLTVGHTGALRDFVALVEGHGVDVLIDTRSNPYSQWVPHWARESLQDAARNATFDYRWMGDSLGGRPAGHDLYRSDGSADYEAIAQTRRLRRYQEGIEDVLTLARDRVVCLMCAEEDPIECHRRLLITKTLLERGITVRHLRRDCTIESEPKVQERYTRKHPPQSVLQI